MSFVIIIFTKISWSTSRKVESSALKPPTSWRVLVTPPCQIQKKLNETNDEPNSKCWPQPPPLRTSSAIKTKILEKGHVHGWLLHLRNPSQASSHWTSNIKQTFFEKKENLILCFAGLWCTSVALLMVIIMIIFGQSSYNIAWDRL